MNILNDKELKKCKSIEDKIDMLFNINKILVNCSSIGKSNEMIWVVPIELKEEVKKIMKNLDLNILGLTNKQVIDLFINLNNLETYLKENNLQYLSKVESLDKQIKTRFNEIKSTKIKNEEELIEDIDFLNLEVKKKSPKESIKAVLNNLKNRV